MPTNSEIEARVQSILDEIDSYGTQKAFAKAIGFTETRISRALDLEKTTDRRLAPIERAIAKLREGENSRNAGRPTVRVKESVIPIDPDVPVVRPPIVEVSAGDGNEVEVSTIGYGEPIPEYLVRQIYHIQPSKLCYLRVRGSSMDGEPARIPPGSILRGKIMDPGELVQDNAVYVIYGPTGLQLKRIKFIDRVDGTRQQMVCLWSDNADAGRDVLPLEVFQRDYRAVIAVLTAEKYL